MRRRRLWILTAALVFAALVLALWPKHDAYAFLRDPHPREFYRTLAGHRVLHHFAFSGSPMEVAFQIRSHGIKVYSYAGVSIDSGGRVPVTPGVTVVPFALTDGRTAYWCEGEPMVNQVQVIHVLGPGEMSGEPFNLPDGNSAWWWTAAASEDQITCEIVIEEDQTWLDRQLDGVKSFLHIR
jgi:hypothetical protein